MTLKEKGIIGFNEHIEIVSSSVQINEMCLFFNPALIRQHKNIECVCDVYSVRDWDQHLIVSIYDYLWKISSEENNSLKNLSYYLSYFCRLFHIKLLANVLWPSRRWRGSNFVFNIFCCNTFIQETSWKQRKLIHGNS